MSYEFLRRITAREFDSLIAGLRKYREAEARMLNERSGKQTIGGGVITND